MNSTKCKIKRFFRHYFRFIPVILTIAVIILCAIFLLNHDVEDLLDYTPDNLWLAALVIIGFFAVKSLSVVLPLVALFICTGTLYPFWIASLLNIVGLMVCFTIPYLVGRFSGGYILRHIERKYPKVKKLVEYSHDNNLFASYMSRAVVVVPGDVVSMLHGSLRMPYKPYLLGSVLGVLPEMLVQTYIGGQLKNLTLKSCLVMIGLIIVTMAFSILLNKKVSHR